MGSFAIIISILLFSSLSCVVFTSHATDQTFFQCVESHSPDGSNIFKRLHTPDSPTYISLLGNSSQNPRWFNSTSQRPFLIMAPYEENEIRPIVLYYEIARKSRVHAFPAGLYPTVGSGGGKLDEIPEDETPFAHRKGNLFNVQYLTYWFDNSEKEASKHVQWDLGVGRNDGNYSYEQARVWGEKYFKGNFVKLAKVKGRVDPDNFFRNEQSIPVLL
ncbi:cannabidiolic acid synthase [Phtheirospermum japonicum]|uniref:Cannabidiolic acid synthase n=1 Tax=Phtheirospermum japonicum TaxID=374723 RepID=A0A830CCC1_9LAMI|nr:cannabidiolic acid synthase [Phtheirospermum japonicum]